MHRDCTVLPLVESFVRLTNSIGCSEDTNSLTRAMQPDIVHLADQSLLVVLAVAWYKTAV